MAKIYERTRKTRRKIGGDIMAFEENNHPRAKDGKFAPKGSGTATGGVKETKVKEIEIDDDYERSYGPTPDKEDDPKGYEKYVKSYQKWKENGDSFDGVDDKNKSLYNDKQIEDFESKLNSDNTVVVEINGKKYTAEYRGESRKNKGYADIQIPELIDRWGDKEPIRDDLGNVVRDGKLYIDYNNLKHAKSNVDDERKQAYKLFDLDF